MRLIGPFQKQRQGRRRPILIGAVTAALERNGVAGRARRQGIERMRAARARPHTPAGGGRSRRGAARVGDEHARRTLLCSGKAQAPRRRQRHLLKHADDERRALRLQALLHGPERIRGARRLDEKKSRRLEPAQRKARPIGKAELAGEGGRPAPEDRRGLTRAGRKRIEAAQREAQREAERGRPARSGTGTRRGLPALSRAGLPARGRRQVAGRTLLLRASTPGRREAIAAQA